jgi:hypothetical protein
MAAAILALPLLSHAQDGPRGRAPQLPPGLNGPAEFPQPPAAAIEWPVGVDPTDTSTMPALLPALLDSGPPPIIKPGLRLTYFTSTAMIPGAGTMLVEDENGLWIGEKTGKRYSEKEVGRASSAGYTQLTIAGLDRKSAAIVMRSYVMDLNAGTLPLLVTTGTVNTAGCGADWWCHPGVLKQALGMKLGAGSKVVRMAYTIGDRTFNAIRFQHVSEAGSSNMTYDAETGILLHAGQAAAGEPQKIAFAGEAGPRAGNASLSQSTLVDIRQIDYPWAAGTTPDWVGQTRAMHYAGAQTLAIPGAGQTSIPMSARLEFQQASPQWLRYRITIEMAAPPGMPNMPSVSDCAVGTAQFGSLWLPPDGMKELRAGQVLDKDPITRVMTSVLHVGPDQQGNDVVAFREDGLGQRVDYAYDRGSGMLIYLSRTDQGVGTTNTTLVFKGRE